MDDVDRSGWEVTTSETKQELEQSSEGDGAGSLSWEGGAS